MNQRVSPARLLALVAFLSAAGARAERLPLLDYTPQDGLAHTRVERIVTDSRGFLWFCTADGLSRFDGSEFVTYRLDLDGPTVGYWDVAEGTDGILWVAVWRGGIGRLDPAERDPERAFIHVPGSYPSTVRRLLFDRAGTLWVGTAEGLFRTDPSRQPLVFEPVPLDGAQITPTPNIWDLFEDRQGRLWVATDKGELLRLHPDGRVDSLAVTPPYPICRNFSIAGDRDGRVWVGHTLGVTVFEPTGPGEDDVSTWYGPERVGDGLILDVLSASDGTVWLTRARGGLIHYAGGQFAALLHADDGEGVLPYRLAEDRTGGLWITTYDAGALRLLPGGFTGYDRRDGLDYSRHAQVYAVPGERVVVVAGDAIYRLQDRDFSPLRLPALAGFTSGSQFDNPVIHQDHRGRWWIATPLGVYRFPAIPLGALARARPQVAYDRDALLGARATAFHEARDGAVWVVMHAVPWVVRREERSGELERLPIEGTLSTHPRAIAGDTAGGVWLAGNGFVLRYRDGKLVRYGEQDGVPSLVYVSLFADSRGRMLIAGRAGVLVVDDPGADVPSFRPLTELELPSSRIHCVVEDSQGRLYLGSHSGVIRLDLEHDSLRRFSAADGLLNGEIWDAAREEDGSLWFTTERGVYRLDPRPGAEESGGPPPIWIQEVRVAGEPRPVAVGGESVVSGVRVARRGPISLRFGSLNFPLGPPVRYRYRLEGTGDDWTGPTAERSVTYAGLGPGHYRFSVEAVEIDGLPSATPASVEFVVLAPLWLRGWFLALTALACAGLAYAAYRYRVARLLELQSVRTRIATDLHDDVGSSLSQIAILAEVVGRQVDEANPLLRRIQEISREMVDGLSDIVWAINPRRDTLADVIRRMRRFASELLPARDIRLEFSPPEVVARTELGADFRRELYLVFKEAVNNAVRHSGCSSVQVRIRIEGNYLHLTIRDDGRGFAVESVDGEGNGLPSMRRRIGAIGGRFILETKPGRGTTVSVRVPLRRSRTPRGSERA
jgi:ligand-binding sensor domain-containing protein